MRKEQKTYLWPKRRHLLGPIAVVLILVVVPSSLSGHCPVVVLSSSSHHRPLLVVPSSSSHHRHPLVIVSSSSSSSRPQPLVVLVPRPCRLVVFLPIAIPPSPFPHRCVPLPSLLSLGGGCWVPGAFVVFRCPPVMPPSSFPRRLCSPVPSSSSRPQPLVVLVSHPCHLVVFLPIAVSPSPCPPPLIVVVGGGCWLPGALVIFCCPLLKSC